MYEERRSRLQGAFVWRRRGAGEVVRILPDGCMDLIWASDGRLIVAGPDTAAQIFESSPGPVLTGLRFAPGIGPIVLGVAAHELRDRRVPLDEIWRPADAVRLANRLAAAAAPGTVLETVAAVRLGGLEGPRRLHETVRLIREGRPIAEVADRLGMSDRHLRRRALDDFGYGPKTLARILRARRAVTLATTGERFADIAARAGYADQAHLAREVRRLAGVPLSRLAAGP